MEVMLDTLANLGGWGPITTTKYEGILRIMSKRIESWIQKIKRYQHMRCTAVIAVATIITFVLSMTITSTPWNSIFPNVFAGLLTGMVITLISSFKGKALKDTEYKRLFLSILHERYTESNFKYRDYRKTRNADPGEYYEAVYDLAAEMQSIESCLSQMDNKIRLARVLGKKPSMLFEDGEDYSFAEQKKRHDELIDFLDSTMVYDEKTRKKIDEMINPIRRAHRVLIRQVMNLIAELEEQKVEIETSVP